MFTIIYKKIIFFSYYNAKESVSYFVIPLIFSNSKYFSINRIISLLLKIFYLKFLIIDSTLFFYLSDNIF